MITTDQKKQYITLLKKIGHESEEFNAITEFIETYDGTNTKEFNALILALVSFIMDYQHKSVKALSFDEIMAVDDEFKDEVEEIKQNFEKAKNGETISPVANRAKKSS